MAQLRIIEDMIGQIDIEIAEDYPDVDQLDGLNERMSDELKEVEADIVAARNSIRSTLDRKRALTGQVSIGQQRIDDIAVSLENFDQLRLVYVSDIARLEKEKLLKRLAFF